MNLTEYLTRVLDDDSCIAQDICDMVTDGDSDLKIDEELLSGIISKLHGREERDFFREKLLDYLPQKTFPQNVFDYLLENKIGLIQLAHMNLDDRKLKKLIPYAEEALFTLAKRYYGRKEYSAVDFARLLCEYDHEALPGQLSFIKPDNPEKERVLFYFCFQDEKRRSEIKKLIESKYLEITDDASRIQAAFESNEPLFRLALSKNLFAPVDILNALSNISGVKNASDIRRNSRETLLLKKYLD